MADNKETVIQQLKDLKESMGWKVIVKALDENIKDAESQLNGDDGKEQTDPAILALLRAKRKDRIALKELPDTLIADISDAGFIRPELDPYDK